MFLINLTVIDHFLNQKFSLLMKNSAICLPLNILVVLRAHQLLNDIGIYVPYN